MQGLSPWSMFKIVTFLGRFRKIKLHHLSADDGLTMIIKASNEEGKWETTGLFLLLLIYDDLWSQLDDGNTAFCPSIILYGT